MAKLNEIVMGTLSQVKDETLDADSLYEITDYPLVGITNAQMAAALTIDYNAFYQTGDVFICTDSGTYLKGRVYKFTGLSWDLVSEYDATPTADSAKPVTSAGVKTYVDNAVNNAKGTSGTATLIATSWNNGSYSLTVSGLGNNDCIMFTPSSREDKTRADSAGLFISPITNGTTVTITAINTPTSNISLDYFIIRG